MSSVWQRLFVKIPAGPIQDGALFLMPSECHTSLSHPFLAFITTLDDDCACWFLNLAIIYFLRFINQVHLPLYTAIDDPEHSRWIEIYEQLEGKERKRRQRERIYTHRGKSIGLFFFSVG